MAVFHQASKTQMSLALFILNYKQQRCYWKINTALCHYSIILRVMSDYLIWFFNTLFLVSFHLSMYLFVVDSQVDLPGDWKYLYPNV